MTYVEQPTAEPVWIDLGFGIELKVRPLCEAPNADYPSIQREAAPFAQNPRHLDLLHEVLALEEQEGADRATAYAEWWQTVVLARAVILEWRGLSGEDGQPVPITIESVIEAMRIPLVARRFRERYGKCMAN